MSVSNEQKCIQKIGEREGYEIGSFSSLAGGSINQVFLLETSSGKKVLKLNQALKFPGMFKAEKKGLETLKAANCIDIPEVYSCGETEGKAYLILEYKAQGNQHPGFWEIFAQELAELHRNSAPEFGFESSNYIGSLPQYNQKYASAAEFYINQRLEPQIRIATDQGFSFKKTEKAFRNISEVIPEESPSLIHGDLWSGNYLVNDQGLPCLIDPAVCYAHREMDLGMMKLFGGFPPRIFSLYSEIFPLNPHFEQRAPLWQLYYLLVHLNIFGSSYFSSVNNILKDYS